MMLTCVALTGQGTPYGYEEQPAGLGVSPGVRSKEPCGSAQVHPKPYTPFPGGHAINQVFNSRQLLCRNVKRFRGGLVFKAHRLVYHPTLGWRVIKKMKKKKETTVNHTP